MAPENDTSVPFVPDTHGFRRLHAAATINAAGEDVTFTDSEGRTYIQVDPARDMRDADRVYFEHSFHANTGKARVFYYRQPYKHMHPITRQTISHPILQIQLRSDRTQVETTLTVTWQYLPASKRARSLTGIIIAQA